VSKYPAELPGIDIMPFSPTPLARAGAARTVRDALDDTTAAALSSTQQA
jgi:hypothetical protein